MKETQFNLEAIFFTGRQACLHESNTLPKSYKQIICERQNQLRYLWATIPVKQLLDNRSDISLFQYGPEIVTAYITDL